MSLEDLERELYGQKKEERIGGGSKKSKNQEKVDLRVENPWQNGEEKIKNKSPKSIGPAKLFIIFLVTVLLVLTGIAGYYLFQYFTTKDVSLETSGPKEVLVGSPFSVSLNFENLSTKKLIDSKLSLSLPDGIYFYEDRNKKITTQDRGIITPGQIIKDEFKLIATGSFPKTYQINASISYTYEGSAFASRFDKKTSFEVLVRDSVINLDLNAPEKVFNGEDFEMSLEYQNISDEILPETIINFKLPQEFKLSNSEPTLENSSIKILNINPKTKGVIILSGIIIGKEYSFLNIEALAQVKTDFGYYDVGSQSVSLSISPSLLNIQISLSNENGFVSPGANAGFLVNFSNNSNETLSDVILVVRPKGEMFDFSSIDSSGYFNDADRSITWTATNLPILKELNTKASGSASFNIKIKDQFPISKLSDKNFTIKVFGEISSPTVPANVIASKTLGVSESEYKISGKLDFSQKVYFDEPSSDITNNGSLPPKVGNPTQYTIHWNLKTLASDFSGIKIKASLGTGVGWTGKVKSNISTVPFYNSRTQEIVWDIPNIQANKGVIEPGPEAIFQVEVIPSSTQTDQSFGIISQANLSGFDEFIKRNINLSSREIDSRNLSDALLPPKFDRVAP
ncbi:MAG: hypothetical protein WC705_02360 [Candidatus Paceibacterota bacterium]|jgi:hypothetical protein